MFLRFRLMRLFEAGIYTKITEEEYQKLYQKQVGTTDNKMVSEGGAKEVEENENRLKPMSIKTLQGAFYILIIGYIISGTNTLSFLSCLFRNVIKILFHTVFTFLVECYYNGKQKRIKGKLLDKWNFIPKIANWIAYVISPTSQHVEPYFRGGIRRNIY